MKTLIYLNRIKRKLFGFTFKFIIKQTKPHGIKLDKENIQNILIIRPNHRLGNQLLITPLVEEVSTVFPHSNIDLFLKGTLGNVIFENYSNVKNVKSLPKKHFKHIFNYLKTWYSLITKEYDLVINVIGYSSSGKLATKLARGKLKFYNL